MGQPLKLPFGLLQLFIANALLVDNPSFQSFPRSKGQLKVEADPGILKIRHNQQLSLQKRCWLLSYVAV